MTAIVFYTSEEAKKFSKTFQRFGVPSYALCWSAQQRALTGDALDTISIYCNISKPSFLHLEGPIIFVQEQVEITRELLGLIESKAANSILVDHQSLGAKDLERISKAFYGISFSKVPETIDLASYQAFRAWLLETAERLLDSSGSQCLLAVKHGLASNPP